ncbi:MAG: DinB family protein [Acidobacteria bacterium]|nr:DinB family protein [Acidobacteriota bacterium]
MTDPRVAEVLRLLNPATGSRPWAGGAKILGCLRGVSVEQALWRPADDRHSIWELTLHATYWKYAVRRRLDEGPRGGFPRAPSNWPLAPEEADATAWKKDRTLLRSEHELLVDAIEGFDPARLDEVAPGASGAYRYLDLMHGIAEHDTYHVGQIQLMKRLYRSASKLTNPR